VPTYVLHFYMSVRISPNPSRTFHLSDKKEWKKSDINNSEIGCRKMTSRYDFKNNIILHIFENEKQQEAQCTMY